MQFADIPHHRLTNQRLVGQPFKQPAEVVQWLGAVQSQDYLGAKWGLAQRCSIENADAAIDQAFADGGILRTHVMRPTWHFVAPADLRWLLELTAPRVRALMAYYDRKLELDDPAIRQQMFTVIEKALHGGNQLTRDELGARLEQAGFPAEGQRLGHIMMHAELDCVICSGARRGKQFTYALFAERVPNVPTFARDEALSELTVRYFASHGPASVKDFVWWSGLTSADVKAGIVMVKSQLASESFNGIMYWFAASMPPAIVAPSPAVYLLPNYDEYGIGYTNHDAVLDPEDAPKIVGRDSSIFNHLIVIDGHAAGTWRRTFQKGAVVIETNLFRPLTHDQHAAFIAATQRYGDYLGMSVSLT